jgi:hypothetical protein
MNLLQLSRLALPILFLGLFASAQAQKGRTNHPFSWKETTDPWYKSPAYSFKYLPTDFTAKGGTAAATTKAKSGHGPVCSTACYQTTAPGACTEALMQEKLKDVELPNFTFPKGYSGVEYVTFEVQTNGQVNGYQVVKQPVLCPPCIQKAVNLVAEMDEWHPAIQDGITVKSIVVVPVYFKR